MTMKQKATCPHPLLTCRFGMLPDLRRENLTWIIASQQSHLWSTRGWFLLDLQNTFDWIILYNLSQLQAIISHRCIVTELMTKLVGYMQTGWAGDWTENGWMRLRRFAPLDTPYKSPVLKTYIHLPCWWAAPSTHEDNELWEPLQLVLTYLKYLWRLGSFGMTCNAEVQLQLNGRSK